MLSDKVNKLWNVLTLNNWNRLGSTLGKKEYEPWSQTSVLALTCSVILDKLLQVSTPQVLCL